VPVGDTKATMSQDLVTPSRIHHMAPARAIVVVVKEQYAPERGNTNPECTSSGAGGTPDTQSWYTGMHAKLQLEARSTREKAGPPARARK